MKKIKRFNIYDTCNSLEPILVSQILPIQTPISLGTFSSVYTKTRDWLGRTTPSPKYGNLFCVQWNVKP